MRDKLSDIFDYTALKELIAEIKKEGANTPETIDQFIKIFATSPSDKLTSEGSDFIANLITDYQQKTMFEEVMSFRVEEQRYLAIQEQAWAAAFVTSEAMYLMVLEAGNDYIRHVNELSKTEDISHTFTALQYINAKTLQQFLEITTLIKNALYDGAIARWRSMYELSVVASFIKKHGDHVAKAYILSAQTDNHYEWARSSNIFSPKKKRIHFSDIQKNCDIETNRWQDAYNLANKIIHASPQRIFGQYKDSDENIIVAVRSIHTVPVAAELAAITLSQVTTDFFSIYSFTDVIVSAKYIENWIDVVREAYFKTHDALFPAEEKLWDEYLKTYEAERAKMESA